MSLLLLLPLVLPFACLALLSFVARLVAAMASSGSSAVPPCSLHTTREKLEQGVSPASSQRPTF
jgi:hypothetical protein